MSTAEVQHETAYGYKAQHKGRARTHLLRLLLLLVVLAVAGAGTWVYFHDYRGSSTSAKPHSVAASVQNLESVVARVNHPVYWAGSAKGYTYELTQTTDGSIYVRYLPAGVAVGDPKAAYTSVGTYPAAHAYASLLAASHGSGATSYRTQSGALVVVHSKTPTSVYFAFPQLGYLMEVYNPSPKQALRLVLSGNVKLIP